MPIVNKTLLRRSGSERCSRVGEALLDPTVLVLVARCRRTNGEGQRHFARRTTRGLDGGLGRRRETVRRYVQRRRELSATEDLHEVLLSREPALDEHVERDVGNTQRARASRFTGVYSTRNGLVKPFNLGCAGGAATGRPRSRLGSGDGLLTLGARPRVLPPGHRYTTDDLLALDRASGDLRSCNFIR